MQSDKIKIAYLDVSHIYAGAERSLCSMIKHLDRDRFEPLLVCPYPMSHHDRYADAGCEMYYLAKAKRWWMGSDYWSKAPRGSDFIARTVYGVRLARMLCKAKAHVLHVNLLRDDVMMWILPARCASIKIVGHYRSDIGSWVPASYVQRLFSRVLCVSRYSMDIYTANQPSQQLEILYDSVDVGSFDVGLSRKECKSRLGLTSDTYLISSVGQLSPNKGHDVAIKAFARIANRYPCAVLFIVGDGVCYGQLSAMIDDYRALRGRIILTGRQSAEMSCIYRASDLVLSLSQTGEAFGLVPYESAIHDTPFLAPDRGAVLEFVEASAHRLLVDPSDVAAIADRIEWLISESQRASEMVSEVKATVMSRLDPVEAATRLADIYDRLCYRKI